MKNGYKYKFKSYFSHHKRESSGSSPLFRTIKIKIKNKGEKLCQDISITRIARAK